MNESARIGTIPRVAIDRISVKLNSDAYDVTIRRGLLPQAGSQLRKLSRAAKCVVITDANIAPLHLRTLESSLNSAGFETVPCILPPGEDHKCLASLTPVYDRILVARIDRSTPIIALGGGVVGDMAGFVAATVLRGVPFVQFPTTLLAMVDASIGGKTGVNHASGKNLIGAFHQPIAVFIDPHVLRTLTPRELRNGLAECIKHEIIRDADGFARLEQNIESAAALDLDYLTGLIAHNVTIKASVVEADPLERGERAHLNFGHTFGHAIERASDYAYSHGESVALGMCAASHVAMKLKLLSEADRNRIVGLIAQAGLPTNMLDLPTDRIIDAMGSDKKVEGARLRFVLPDRIGHVVIRDDVPIELVSQAIDCLRE